jgi:tetratricopeptide (TPR) repeat protein
LLVATYVFLFPNRKLAFSRARVAAMSSLPFWIVLAGYLLLRLGLLGRIATSQRNWQLSPLAVVLTAAHLMASYWWKLLVPVKLNAYHVFSPTRSLLDARAVAGILFVAMACGLIVYATRRKPLVAFTAAWVFITLLPVMDIYAVGRNVFAERYLYLPSVGFCLLLTLVAFEVLQRIPVRFRKWAGIAALTAIVLLSALEIVARNRDWKDDATLFTRTLETSPNAPFAHNMVAASESDHSASVGSAEDHYLKAISYASAEDPPDRVQMAMAYKGLAAIYSYRSDFSRALEMLGRARAAAPDDPEMDGEQGLVLTRAGRWDEAEKYLQRAAANSLDDANVLNALGIFAQQHSHELDRAADYFRRALAVHTDQDDFEASLHNNLGTIYGEQRHYEDAITQFNSAVTIAPTDLEYRTNLAMALAASGRYDDARAEIRVILAVDPTYQPALAVTRQLNSR